MNSENINESKDWFTSLAKAKAMQNGHNKQMYWADDKHEYYVEAWREGKGWVNYHYTKA